MNGFLSFDMRYMSYTPFPFPHRDGLDVDLLGAFWADADSSGRTSDCCGDVVYYHVYKKDLQSSSSTSKVSRSVQRILDMATLEGQLYIANSFQANWAMVVTWKDLIPWPFDENQYSYEVHYYINKE